MDNLQKTNESLVKQIEDMKKKEEESVPEPVEEVKEFRAFGLQTELVRVLPVIKTCETEI